MGEGAQEIIDSSIFNSIYAVSVLLNSSDLDAIELDLFMVLVERCKQDKYIISDDDDVVNLR